MMVLESARRQLSKLAPLADQLNSASDNFTRELKIIEAELQKLSLGVEVTCRRPLVIGDATETTDDSGEHEPIVSRENLYLGYGPFGPEWRLLVRKFRVYESQSLDDILLNEVPLVKATRELRMAAAEQIEELLAEVEREATTKLESLRKVADPFTMPPGWEKHLLGQDNKTGVVHVMKGQSGVALCGHDIVHWGFYGLHNSGTIEGGSPCTKCEALELEARSTPELPAGWENHLQAVDDAGVVHVLKKDRSGDGICGARTVNTNFMLEGKRFCPKCRALVSGQRK